MNARDALARLQALGCIVETVNRTGEIRIRPPGAMAKCITTSHPSRRKDAARVVVQLLKRLEGGKS